MDKTNLLLWLVPLLPLAGFLINAFLGARLTRSPGPGAPADAHLDKGGQAIVGGLATALVWAAFAVSLALFFQIIGAAGEARRIFSPALDWMVVPAMGGMPGLDLKLRLCLDPLSSLMTLIVTGVGALIHGYSMGYMSHERGYARYFAYLNLFVFFMLLLVMASNFLVMFIGWEGVGLASYLLIGFFYERRSATEAGKKAFVVNRIGDAALLVALFLIYRYFGTFEFYGPGGVLTAEGIDAALGVGFGAAASTAVPLLLFAGAAGKSAQIPLYVWLPDAMEGPTPVSALIHAATMVTAGVYLLCRAHLLFVPSAEAMWVVALIGLATAIVAASIGLAQNDIKKVLAYSTVSQLGFMFLACGVGAFGAAMFHVTTHAFFKALLFLGSGSVIHAMGGEQDMRRMGALAGKIQATYRTMFIGTLAIAGIAPLAGFWSKDEILAAAFRGSPALWLLGVATAGMTAFYMWRMMAKTFLGEARYEERTASQVHESPLSMRIPLYVLAALSVAGGFLNAAPLGIHALDHFLGETVHPAAGEGRTLEAGLEWGLAAVSLAVAAGCSLWAWSAYKRRPSGQLLTQRSGWLYRRVADAWGVDAFYEAQIVEPGRRLAQWLWRTVEARGIDGAVNGVAATVASLANGLKEWQSGYVRNYALSMLVGLLLVVIGCLLGLSGEFAPARPETGMLLPTRGAPAAVAPGAETGAGR